MVSKTRFIYLTHRGHRRRLNHFVSTFVFSPDKGSLLIVLKDEGTKRLIFLTVAAEKN